MDVFFTKKSTSLHFQENRPRHRPVLLKEGWVLHRRNDHMTSGGRIQVIQVVTFLSPSWVFPKIVVPPIIHFNRGFPLFSPSILGYPYFRRSPTTIQKGHVNSPSQKGHVRRIARMRSFPFWGVWAYFQDFCC